MSLEKLLNELSTQILMYGDCHNSVANIHEELAAFFFQNNNFIACKDYLQNAFQIRARIEGKLNEQVIDLYFWIGLLFKEISDPISNENFETHMNTNFQMRSKFDSSNTQDSDKVNNKFILLMNYMDSTMIYCFEAMKQADLGNFLESERLFNKSIDLRENKYGADSIGVALSLKFFGKMLLSSGKILKAEETLQNCLSIYTSNNNDHQQQNEAIADVLFDLSQVSLFQNDYVTAEKLLTDCFLKRRNCYGKNHILTTTTKNKLFEVQLLLENTQQNLSNDVLNTVESVEEVSIFKQYESILIRKQFKVL
jgi:hypothetical protein